MIIVVGLLVGFNFSTSPLEVVAGLGLLLLFGYAFSWIFAFIALNSSSPEGAQALGFMVIFPLTFASSAFVRRSRCPRRSRRSQTRTRSAPSSTPREPCSWALRRATTCGARSLWCVGLIVVFAGLSVHRYRRAVSS